MSLLHQPGVEEFERLAHEAVQRLPEVFRRYLDNVVFRVEEFATEEQLAAVGLSDPWRLSGLYHGQPWGDSSIWQTGGLPPVITLFRQPLLQEWRARALRLEDLVEHVIVHEVGHHFGLSDAQMAAIERQ
jgi:predicted Zn-dependent protease with MMP-like domain